MSETTNAPHVDLQLETLTYTRSDGKVTTFNIISDVLDKGDVRGAFLHAMLMKLTGVMEFQEIMAKQNSVMLEALQAMAGALQQLTARAAEPIKMPDPAQAIQQAYKALSDMGLVMPPGTPAGASGNGPSSPAVEITRPGDEETAS